MIQRLSRQFSNVVPTLFLRDGQLGHAWLLPARRTLLALTLLSLLAPVQQLPLLSVAPAEAKNSNSSPSPTHDRAKSESAWRLIKPEDENKCLHLRRGPATSFQITNKTSIPISLFWVDAKEQRQRYLDLNAGEKKNQGTYANQVWLIADQTGKVKGIFSAGPEPATIEVSPTGIAFRAAAQNDSLGFQAQQSSAASADPVLAGSYRTNTTGNPGIAPSAALSPGSYTNNSTAEKSGTSNSSATGDSRRVPSDLSSLPNEDTIPFRKTQSGWLYVDAQLSGRPLEMVFDTGANACCVGENHLKAAGIDPATLKGKSTLVGGSSGKAVTAKIVPMDLRLGKTTRRVEMFVQKYSPTPPLVGQNFLTGLQYEVNNQLELIRLKKSTNTVGKSGNDVYDARDRNAVPFKLMGQNIVVPVEICGKEVPMIFDTGAACSMAFPLRTWLQLKLPAKLIGRTSSMGIDGTTATLVYVVDRVDFGPVSMKDIKVFVSNPGPVMPLLGQSVLGGEKFIIDNSRNVIRFHR